MSVPDKILSLTRQLYPKGRAFRMPFDGALEKLHMALSLSEARLQADIISVLDSALPDNDNFTEDDASAWEARLGLITNETVPLSDRMLAIQRKMNHPGVIPARQAASFLEHELQAAGFHVYVYENIFDDGMGGFETRTPLEVSGVDFLVDLEYGVPEYGDGSEYGGIYSNLIANSITAEGDAAFDIGPNLRSTFFIGGAPLGQFANVDSARKLEFRQLILKIKSAHCVGFLFINYI